MVVVSGFDSAREGREHEAAKGMIVATGPRVNCLSEEFGALRIFLECPRKSLGIWIRLTTAQSWMQSSDTYRTRQRQPKVREVCGHE